MQTPTQGMTRAQANAVRTTCTACHQRKVKCDAHDRGYPCSRCIKSGSGSDCRLHLKNRRVSRARQALGEGSQAQSARATHRVKGFSPAKRPPPVEESILEADELSTLTTAAAAAPTTPGSSFLQTVIANESRASAFPDAIKADVEAHDKSQIGRQNGPHTPNDVHHNLGDAALVGPGTVGSTAASVTTASTPAVLHTHSADGEYKKYLVEFIDQPQLEERPIDKSTRVLYVGSQLSNMNFLLRQRTAKPGRQNENTGGDDTSPKGGLHPRCSNVVHYATNRIPRPSARQGGFAAEGLPFEAFQLPPKRTVDQLLAAYLQYINPGFPVVDGALFMRQYHARDPQNPPSLLLLQAILVAAAHVFYNDPEERAVHKSLYFRRAKMLLDACVERNRDTVVQAALLLTWHADGPEDVGANAWHWVGLAARTATGLGMHRDAEASKLVPQNKRTWRRVWWLLVVCDVLVALQYGRPPALHLDDTDVRLPIPADFDDCGDGTQVEYVLQLVQLCILLSKHVLRRQFRDGVGKAANTASAAAYLRRTDEALASWYLHLPSSLQLGRHGDCLSTASNTPSSINVWTAFLHLIYNTALILLHREVPSVASAMSSSSAATLPISSGAGNIEICTNAAVAIQQICHGVCASGQAVSLWSSAISSLFTALIQLSGDVHRLTSPAAVETGSPLLAVAALRRYEGALSSLRQLAVYWPNAQSVVQFFEQSVRPAPVGSLAATAATSASTTTNTNSAESSRSTSPTMPAAAFMPPDHLANGSHGAHVDMPMHMNAAMDNPMARLHHDGIKNDPHGAIDTDGMPHSHLMPGMIDTSRPMMPYDGTGLTHQHQDLDPWNTGTPSVFNTDWQRIYWQQPEMTEDVLLTF
ncbi:hypothetical protein SEPCBS119000_000154 [Sporothrix epigloea]|uniref:Zn(2)-C6 fungal-type domain-containing protein n=1 Tax=Sporothrix epigloea TaxID=1892477 RepID=A0ABP0D3I2_9PEZI